MTQNGPMHPNWFQMMYGALQQACLWETDDDPRRANALMVERIKADPDLVSRIAADLDQALVAIVEHHPPAGTPWAAVLREDAQRFAVLSTDEILHLIARHAYHEAEQALHALIDETLSGADQRAAFKAALCVVAADMRFPSAAATYGQRVQHLMQVRARSVADPAMTV